MVIHVLDFSGGEDKLVPSVVLSPMHIADPRFKKPAQDVAVGCRSESGMQGPNTLPDFLRMKHQPLTCLTDGIKFVSAPTMVKAPDLKLSC